MTAQTATQMAETYITAARAGAAQGRYADACIEAALAHDVATWRAAADALRRADREAYRHAADALTVRMSL